LNYFHKKASPDKTTEVRQGVDLRGCRRFLVKSVAVAALNDSRVGIILDISRTGLAFRYIDFNHGTGAPLQEPTEVSIINDTASFSLLDLPCKIIREQDQLPGFYISSLKMNKCCLRFGTLTSNQKSKIEYFIAHFTDHPTSLLP